MENLNGIDERVNNFIKEFFSSYQLILKEVEESELWEENSVAKKIISCDKERIVFKNICRDEESKTYTLLDSINNVVVRGSYSPLIEKEEELSRLLEKLSAKYNVRAGPLFYDLCQHDPFSLGVQYNLFLKGIEFSIEGSDQKVMVHRFLNCPHSGTKEYQLKSDYIFSLSKKEKSLGNETQSD